MATKLENLIERVIKDNPIGIGKEYSGTRWGMARINKNEYFIEDVKMGRLYEVVKNSKGTVFVHEISKREAGERRYI